ncbi:DEAD/DEAH box helicase, partial [Bdellovibrionota bacterium FG-2]
FCKRDTPNTGWGGGAVPWAGLHLSGDLGVAGLAGTAAKNLSRFFHGPGKSKPSQYGGFIFLGILPQSSQQSVQRLALLQDFSQALKSAQKLQKLLVDSAIPGMLEHEIHLLEWRADYPNHKKPLLKTFREMKVDLYPYQKEGVERALSEGRFLLGDDMGLGKTIQAITWAESLLKTGLAKTVVIICPAALKSQWRREWQQSSGRDVKIVEGSPSDRKMIYQNPPPVLILNYELLLRDLENILALAPDAVVLDEAQRIKNYASETARRVKRLNPRFRLVLTGTPMENRIEELSSLMDWVADGAMGPSWRLGAELSFADGVGHARAGVRGLGVLRKRLEPHMLRRLRSEVLPQLPKRTDTPIFLPLTDEQRDLHDEYGRKVALLARVAQQRPLTPAEHLRLMNLLAKMRIVSNALVQHDYEAAWPSIKAEKNPEAKLPYLSSPKLGEFRNLIEGLLSQKGVKIIIFSQWQRMLHLCSWAVSDLLRKEAVEAVFFTGAESTKQRTENIVRFHDDPSVRLFFATDAGGVGLNLQRAATVCINLELPWNPAVLEQRIGRIYRLGQESPVQIYHLITQGSIEERITALVGNKRAVFNALFDGHSDEVVFENGGGFYSQVQNVMHEMKLTPDVLDAPDDSDAENSDAETSDSEVSEEPVLAAPPAPAVTEAVVESVMADVLNSGEQALPSLSSGLSSETLAKAFSELKIAKSTDGVLSIEARGESAKLLAGLFRGMADLFDK